MVDTSFPDIRRRRVREYRTALEDFFDQVRDNASEAHFTGATLDDVFDPDEWASNLDPTLFGLSQSTAQEIAERVVTSLDADLDEFDPDIQRPWLEEHSRIAAENITAATGEKLDEALGEDRPLSAITSKMDEFSETNSEGYATSMVTAVGMFAAYDGARAAGAGTKTWHTNSGNSRSEHARLDGETVLLDEEFSNGLMWPGDPSGDADEIANCQCSLTIN